MTRPLALSRPLGFLLSVASLACAPSANGPADADRVLLGGPPGFLVMEMGGGLHATWQDAFSDETGFELERREGSGDFELLLGLAANVTDHHDQTPNPGVPYTYRVRAVASDGPGAWSSESTATVPVPAPVPPGAPTRLAAARMGGALHLSWRDNSTDETAFELERKSGTAAFARIATVAANTSDRMDMSVVPGTSYTYRVRAVGDAGPSEWSNETSGTP